MYKELYQFLSQFLTENKLELFEKIIPSRTRHVTVVLEDIFQAHNASAVIRSCDCFGIQDLHIIENTNQYNPYRNATAGSQKWVNLYKYNQKENNTVDCLNELKQKGYKIIATTPHRDSVMISDLPLDDKIALVFGTELEGISQDVIDHADGFVKIPMYGFTESYNISVAASLSLYQIRLNLEKSDIPWQLTEEQRDELLCQWAERGIKLGKKLKEEFIKKHSTDESTT